MPFRRDRSMETIREIGARFQSLSGPWADSTTHAGKMIMTVFAGIAEFERDLIRERTGAGREAAKQRGVRFGRPPKLASDQKQLEHFSYRCSGTGRCQCGFSLKKSHVKRISAVHSESENALHARAARIMTSAPARRN